MRRFLYISPYFPPDARVGALRPLKFVRHLPACGWMPVVLADFRPGAGQDAELLAALPPDVPVLYGYGWHSEHRSSLAPARAAASLAQIPQRSPVLPSSLAPVLERVIARVARNPELVPLGEDLIDLPHAYESARRVFARESCAAIVVNADPFAALLVGRSLARETGAPLLADLRDPWALCEIRRPLRPPLQRAIVDALERRIVEDSAFVVLNTENARDVYRAFYADLPAERFVTIRNHADGALTASVLAAEGTADTEGAPFQVLFLGHLRRFVEGETLFAALRELARRGKNEQRLRLRIVGSINASVRDRIRELGVASMIEIAEPVAFSRIGAVMAAADLLVVTSHAGRQRIPAKTYEYFTSSRPILAITDNPELRSLIERAGGATWCAHGDVIATADRVEAEMAWGRRRHVARSDLELDSGTAARRLANLLNHAVSRSATRR
ncbi:MAG: hypothetical protein JW751_05515 [Polyangiaceae bacterium]|nr:hypothetical protein [Polyangiaceae bacterium]